MPIGLSGKIVSGLLAMVAVTTGGVMLNNYVKSKTIGEELQSTTNVSLLPKESNQWSSLLEKYKTAIETDKEGTPKKIKGLNSVDSIQKLQEECQKLWDTKLDTENLEKERIQGDLRNWCTTNPKALEAK